MAPAPIWARRHLEIWGRLGIGHRADLPGAGVDAVRAQVERQIARRANSQRIVEASFSDVPDIKRYVNAGRASFPARSHRHLLIFLVHLETHSSPYV